jgi:membrane protease YdiL (CAAX protease family)
MKLFLQKYGMYVVMVVAIVAIQVLTSLEGFQGSKVVGGQQEGVPAKTHFLEKIALPESPSDIPMVLLVLVAGIILVVGTGLVADAIVAMRWMLARSQGKAFLNVQPRSPGPWTIEDLIKVFIIFFFAASCLRGVMLIALGGQWASREALGSFALIFGTLGLYGIVLIVLASWERKRGARDFFRFPAWAEVKKHARTGLSAYFVFVPILIVLLFASILGCQILGIEAQPHELVDILRREPSLGKLAYLGLLTMLIGPIMEEILFRGVVYSALRQRMGVATAAMGSALIFSIAHTNAAQTLPIFGMGMLLALLYEHTGGLLSSIVFHCLNNTFAFILTMAMLSVWS